MLFALSQELLIDAEQWRSLFTIYSDILLFSLGKRLQGIFFFMSVLARSFELQSCVKIKIKKLTKKMLAEHHYLSIPKSRSGNHFTFAPSITQPTCLGKSEREL